MRFKKNCQPLSHYERNWLKSWSGREDSNLRPLPPEDSAALKTARNSALLSHSDTGTGREHPRFAGHFYRAVTARDIGGAA